MSGDGSIIKADKDYTNEVDAAIPEAEKLAQVPLLLLIHLHPLTNPDPLAVRPTAALNGQTHGAREANTPILRPPLDVAITRRHRDNMQGRGRLELDGRAGAAVEQEAWAAEAGHHEDGAGGDGIYGRYAERGGEDASH